MRFFKNRFIGEFDKMYSQKAFVHWYIESGMEQGEFEEERQE